MKKLISKVYDMLMVVDDFLKNSAAIVKTIEGLEPALEAFFTNVLKLKESHKTLQTLPDKPAAVKQKAEKEIDKLLLFNSRKHVAYAVKTDNLDLEIKVTVKKSDLKQDDKSKFALASGLYDLNDKNLKGLEAHGITAATQAAFKKTIAEYEKSIPQTRENTSSGSTTLADFEALVVESKMYLQNTIDKLVNGADEDKAEFVSNYFNNRKTINPPTSKIALRGTVKNSKSGEALGGVLFSLDGIKIKSTAKGNFRLDNKEAGVYTMVADKPGFKSQKMQVTIGGPGETTLLSIQLDES